MFLSVAECVGGCEDRSGHPRGVEDSVHDERRGCGDESRDPPALQQVRLFAGERWCGEGDAGSGPLVLSSAREVQREPRGQHDHPGDLHPGPGSDGLSCGA